MAWDWAKIGKGALIGLGTVLSIIPAVGPIVGGGLIATGAAIPTKPKTGTVSTDPVNNAAAALGAALGNASAYNTITQPGGTAINANGVLVWFQTNFKLVAGIVAGIILLVVLFRKKRR